VKHALGPVLDLAGGATVPVRTRLGPAEPAVIDGDKSHETCADAIHSDDLEAAIQGGLVSLDQIIEARWRSRPECNPNAAERQRFLRFLPELERLYGAGHGGAIQETYFSRDILAGVVLTADHEIHLRYPPESVAAVSPEFEEAIWRCTSLSRQGFPDMDAVDRTTALRMLHSLAVRARGGVLGDGCAGSSTLELMQPVCLRCTGGQTSIGASRRDN